MLEAFDKYFDAIREFDEREDTEHTLRPALHNLLESLKPDAKLAVKHETKRDKQGRGAPDFTIKLHEGILGYLEAKKVGEDLGRILKTDQIAKYKKLSDNIVLTNYLDWIWIRNGQVALQASLCPRGDAGNRRAKLNPEHAQSTGKLLAAFLSIPAEQKGIARARDLAPKMAVRCHDLREFLLEELKRQNTGGGKGRLFGLYAVFKQDVFHELSLEDFADAFAQMLGYGLFLARLNAGANATITLENARRYIPANFELIRELVNFLDELENAEYREVRWLVEELLSIMNFLDLAGIQEDLAFSNSKRQGRLIEQTEDERLLYARDPYIYFYETFLRAYDKQTSKGRGVYYTPPPVVNFIVRAVNDILKDVFGIRDGLADRKQVTVLDFATGTGTFLLEVLEQIFETVSPGIRNQVIREHVLKNLYGFEYLIAPYTIAHLKLSQYLLDKGYEMQPGERLQIYLTNTLEPVDPQPNFLLPALSREVQEAQTVKDKPILVIMGNPPYSGISKNNGKWISRLIDTYKFVDGQPFGEKKHWLNDDYVKFIRFAQWKMEQVEEGIVGIITNHSFLDNPTFRGMRQSLMQAFDAIYILDLHGNAKKKEAAPDGSKDENVFDIEQGVAISILVKGSGADKGLFYQDLWGSRRGKYQTLLDGNFPSQQWATLSPNSPFYFFVPRQETAREEYDAGFRLTEIFPVNVTGIVTARDDLATDFEDEGLLAKLNDFAGTALSDQELRQKYFPAKTAKTGQKYEAGDTRGWKIPDARSAIRSEKQEWPKNIVSCLYRPFDVRKMYYKPSMVDWGRWDKMAHIAYADNISLCIGRQFGVINSESYDIVWASKYVVDFNFYRRGGEQIFPLYTFKSGKQLNRTANFFESSKIPASIIRQGNFSLEFWAFINKQYGQSYAPEQIFGYIYAVLHSPTYREKYREFLKSDFPRIPFVPDRATFEALSALGWDLAQAHLLRKLPSGPKVDIHGKGDDVEKPLYVADTQRLYINKDRYFAPVPKDVWEFHIGGYQVLDKYLKSRKGRTLSLDEIENVFAIVKALAFTIEQMQRIEEVWKP